MEVMQHLILEEESSDKLILVVFFFFFFLIGALAELSSIHKTMEPL